MGGRADAAEPRVWQINALEWETAAAVDPVGEPWPLAAWLASLPEEGLMLRVLPVSLIAGGPCGGGHVLLAESWGDRLYFAVPPGAIPALIGHLPEAEFADLVRRTPALGEPGAAR